MYTMTDEDRKAKDSRLVIQKRQAALEETNAKMRCRQPLEARAFHSEKSPQRRFCYVTSRMPTHWAPTNCAQQVRLRHSPGR